MALLSEPVNDTSLSDKAAVVEEVQSEPVASIRLRGEFLSRVMVDTTFDNPREDIVEWWNHGFLGFDHKQGDWRVVLQGRLRWGVAAREVLHQPRWVAEPDLRDAYVEKRFGDFRLSFGQRIFTWGKNEFMAAADVVNAYDLRYDVVTFLQTPRDAKISTTVLGLSYFSGDLGAEWLLIPFFSGHRAYLWGRDFALAAPQSPLAILRNQTQDVSPQVADALQRHSIEVGTPEAAPTNVSTALRFSGSRAGWDAAATFYYGWDRTPRVTIDPDLRLLLEANAQILDDPNVLLTNPALNAAAENVRQKRARDESLLHIRYRRKTQLALEAQTSVGELLLRTDLGFSPEQVFYGQSQKAYVKPTATGALGAEWTRGETWYVALTGYSLLVFQAPHDELFYGFEDPNHQLPSRSIAALYGIQGTTRFFWEALDLTAELTGLYNIRPGDWLAHGHVTYTGLEAHQIRLGMMALSGPEKTVGWYYRRNNMAYLQYRGVW